MWLHPGIRVLLREDGTTSNPIEAIRRRARQLVDHALGLDWQGPPFDMEVLASLIGLRLDEVDTLGPDREASCIPGAILLSRRFPPRRRRYSVAHEVVHQFIPDEDDGTSIGALSPREQSVARGELELLCQIGAAELLMPKGAFEGALGPDAPAFARVESLADQFEVSIEAAARRVVDLSTHAVALLMARPGDEVEPRVRARAARPAKVRGEIKSDDILVTAWVAPPSFCTVRVAIGEPVPRKSCIRRAWGWGHQYPKEGRIYRKAESWATYPELGMLDVEAVPLPRWKQPIEVLAIVQRRDQHGS